MNLLVKVKPSAYGIGSDFGEALYWNNGTVTTETYLYIMLSAITRYNNIDSLHGLHLTPQDGLNWGISALEQARQDATVFELSYNLICMHAVNIQDKKQITIDVYGNTLSYLMSLKREKICVVKARGCTDGRQQQKFISKEGSSSPTVSTYVLFKAWAMDVKAERQVITSCDIPKSFLQANQPEDKNYYLKFK